MVRSLKGVFMAVLTAAVLAVPGSAQDVSGKWTVTVQSPDVGDVVFNFDFEQNGTELMGTGTSSMAEIESIEVSDGLVEDGIISFLLHIGAQGQYITVEVEGDVDGDEMSGEAYIAEMGQSAPFTAKRADG
ncbi:MAG: hypothetical protein AAF389_18130 [Gemmatimonadota bacterium]